MSQQDVEYWLQGSLPGIPTLLQPAAHALIQARKEINELMRNYPDDLLWQMPAGIASPAFHLQHVAGVLSRLFTYANNQQLSEEQLVYLSREGTEDVQITVQSLLNQLNNQIDLSIQYLQKIKPGTFTETRYVGRKKIASTQIGLLFHAAEHTMRHTGQLLVTVKIILNNKES